MEQPIDIKAPVLFYDDRNKNDVDYRLVEVLYAGKNLCLCSVEPIVRPGSRLESDIAAAKENKDTDEEDPDTNWDIGMETVLFDVVSGEVLTNNLEY